MSNQNMYKNGSIDCDNQNMFGNSKEIKLKKKMGK